MANLLLVHVLNCVDEFLHDVSELVLGEELYFFEVWLCFVVHDEIRHMFLVIQIHGSVLDDVGMIKRSNSYEIIF